MQPSLEAPIPSMVYEEAGAEKARAAERSIAAIRLMVISFNSLVYHFMIDQAGTIPWLAYLIILMSGAYGLAVFLLEPYRRYPVMRSSYFTSITDAIFITLWLYATGGIASPFYVLLYVSIIAIAFRYNARETISAAAMYAVSYLVLLALLGQWAGHQSDIAIRIGYIFLVAAIGALFARETVQQTRAKFELRHLTHRLEQEIAERMRITTELAEAQQRLSEGREAERLHLAQELHDGPVQDLYGVRFQLGELVESLDGASIIRVGVAELQISIQHVISTLRNICGELRPPALAPFGLEVALRSHAGHFQKTHPDFAVTLDLSPDGLDLPEHVRLTLFRIYQQALNNVVRHAQARAVLVQLAVDAEQIVLTIQDDGCGFVVPLSWLEFARQGHLGLLGAAERAEAIGGELEIVSAAGEGTIVRVVVRIVEHNPVDVTEL
jgi:signal transduction histidine kinase